MKIGAIIKRLRRERDMTQEQLAEYLGVTSQAVSRWETETAMPDIAQLPVLANIFDVSTDTLLGVDITEKAACIQAIIDDAWENHTARGYPEEAIAILRNALTQYPNSYKLMGWLVSNLSSTQSEGELRHERDLELIALGEKILAECTDDTTRHTAIQHLCYTYPAIGEPEKAEALAMKMPNGVISREMLLEGIYKGTKSYEHKQDHLLMRLQFIISSITHMNLKLDDGTTPYSIDERIALQQKALSVIDILFEDGNYGFMHNHLIITYKYLTILNAEKGDFAAALYNLRRACHHAGEMDKYNPEDLYTCLLFRGSDFGSVAYHSPESESAQLLTWMQSDKLDSVRDTAEYKEVEAELRARG